jgi:methionyl-tRNA synthetase
MDYVSYDEFKKMDMRFGLIRFVEPVEGTDKLLRFEIDFGSLENEELPFEKEEYQGRDVRQIVSGIREYFPEYEQLVGTYGLYILNLEPREIRGVMSHGMLMAVDGVDGAPVFVGPQGDIEPGSRIR